MFSKIEEVVGANSARLPDACDIQIDKRSGEWFLTYWVNAEITIRLRIRHTGALEPSEFLCELADVASDHEFQLLAHFLWHRDDDPELFEWPSLWRNEFLRLSLVWARCLELGEWGLAMGNTPIVRDEADGGEGSTEKNIDASASYAGVGWRPYAPPAA